MHSRVVPFSLQQSLTKFVDVGVREPANLEDCTVNLANDLNGVVKGTKEQSDELKRHTKQVMDAARELGGLGAEVVKRSACCKRLAFSCLHALEELEKDSVRKTLKQSKYMKTAISVNDEKEFRKRKDKLSKVLSKRKAETLDKKGSEVLDKLCRKIEAEGNKWIKDKSSREAMGQSLGKTLDFLERFVQAFAHSSEQYVKGFVFFDPRPIKEASRALVAATLTGDSRTVVAWAKKLVPMVGERKHAQLKEATLLLVDQSKKYLSDVKAKRANAEGKSEMIKQTKVVASILASMVNEQHNRFKNELKSKYLIYGGLVDVAVFRSLLELGSDPVKTEDEYVWVSSKNQKRANKTKEGSKGEGGGGTKPVAQPVQTKTVRQDPLLPVMGRCSVCSREIRGKIVSALNASFHPDHFSCTRCSRVIEPHETFMPDPRHAQRPCCKSCSAKAMNETALANKPLEADDSNHGPCGKCGRVVEGGDCVKAYRKVYHKRCLQCSDCQKVLSGEYECFKGRSGFIVCKPCLEGKTTRSSNRTPPAAVTKAVASAPVKRESLRAEEPVRRPSRRSQKAEPVRVCAGCAKDISPDEHSVLWDGPRIYHKQCFACKACSKFVGGKDDKFYISDGDMLCKECYSDKLFKCKKCLQPLMKDGSEIKEKGYMFHKACYGSGAPVSEKVKVGPPPVPSRQTKDKVKRPSRGTGDVKRPSRISKRSSQVLDDSANGVELHVVPEVRRPSRRSSARKMEDDLDASIAALTAINSKRSSLQILEESIDALSVDLAEQKKSPRRPSKPLPKGPPSPAGGSPPPSPPGARPNWGAMEDDDDDDEDVGPSIQQAPPRWSQSEITGLSEMEPPAQNQPPPRWSQSEVNVDHQDRDSTDIMELIMAESEKLSELHEYASAGRRSSTGRRSSAARRSAAARSAELARLTEDDIENDQLDDLMENLMTDPKPSFHDDGSRRDSGVIYGESCWACLKDDAYQGADVCRYCGEANLNIPTNLEELDHINLDDSDDDDSPPPPPPKRAAAEYDDLSQLISELGE